MYFNLYSSLLYDFWNLYDFWKYQFWKNSYILLVRNDSLYCIDNFFFQEKYWIKKVTNNFSNICCIGFFKYIVLLCGYFFMFPSSGVLYDISKAYSLYSNGLNVPLLICLLTWIAYYLEYSSFNISEDDSKKSIGKVVVLAVFRQIITRILRVLVAMALVGLLCPFILKIFF